MNITESISDFSTSFSSNNDSTAEKCLRSPTNPFYYITLAKESPPRQQHGYESEISTYDGFNTLETDICRDTSDSASDTESYSTDDMAPMNIHVIEYEVANPSDDDQFFSQDSSSGPDDIVDAASFAELDSGGMGIHGDKLDRIDGPFGNKVIRDLKEEIIFADTEDGPNDGFSDPELGSGDYWTCVKCKNRQNNPLYPICERCYQVRRSHFPPRPKRRKNLKNNHVNQPKSSFRQRNSNGNKILTNTSNSQLDSKNSSSTTTNSTNLENTNSLGESDSVASDDNDSSGQNHGHLGGSPVAASRENSQSINRMSKPLASDKNSDAKLGNNSSCSSSPTLPTIDLSDNLNVTKMLHSKLMSKDSGISSCSSQELTPDAETKLFVCPTDSQETYSSELDSDLARKLSSLDSTPDLKSVPRLGEAGGSSSAIPFNGVRASPRKRRHSTKSDEPSTVCSPIAPLKKSKTIDNFSKSHVLSDDATDVDRYGSCIMCLTQPKNGVFVHKRILHVCSCYRCAVKVWHEQKRCPICNLKINNVMKLFVH